MKWKKTKYNEMKCKQTNYINMTGKHKYIRDTKANGLQGKF